MSIDEKSLLTAERVRELLHYDPETGLFTWKVALSRAKGVRPGMVAGTTTGSRYNVITIKRRRFVAHRLAWLYMTGKWPEKSIDHKDGNGTNNRWCNLRECTHAENLHNTGKFSTNTSGYKGAFFCRDTGRWRSRIKVNGRDVSLGRFDDPLTAHRAYMAAAVRYFGEFARAE